MFILVRQGQCLHTSVFYLARFIKGKDIFVQARLNWRWRPRFGRHFESDDKLYMCRSFVTCAICLQNVFKARMNKVSKVPFIHPYLTYNGTTYQRGPKTEK